LTILLTESRTICFLVLSTIGIFSEPPPTQACRSKMIRGRQARLISLVVFLAESLTLDGLLLLLHSAPITIGRIDVALPSIHHEQLIVISGRT